MASRDSKAPRSSAYALALLSLTYACHGIDRAALSVVIEPLKRHFALTDTEVGLLNGVAYAGTFALAILPVGWLVDRCNRRNLLAGMLFVWSGLTALAATAQNFLSLFLIRMGIGAAECGASPLSLSLISDLYPPHRRASAIGIFYIASPVGTAVAFVIGGLLAESAGWRAVFFIAGLPGLLLTLLLFTLHEPVRGACDEPATMAIAVPTSAPAPAWTTLRLLAGNPVFICLFLGIGMASASLATWLIWSSPFLMRVHAYDLRTASFAVGLAAGLFSGAGSVVGGSLSDRVARGVSWRLPLVSAAALVLAFATGQLTAWAPNGTIAIMALCATAFLGGIWLGPTFAMGLSLVPASTRGLTGSVMQLASTLMGTGTGPLIAGMLSDAIGGPTSLRPTLAIMAILSLLSAGLLLTSALLARRQMHHDIAFIQPHG